MSLHQFITLAIPQPCNQSWAAMTPASAGRHCAACQQTVVDFTQKTDAEILAYLARAAGSRTCGRFAAGQLARPLQRAALAAPVRWRAWLAAAVAVWGLREGSAAPAEAQATVQTSPRYWGGPVPAAAPAQSKPDTAAPAQPVEEHASRAADSGPVVLRGVITDAQSGEKLLGATVLLHGTLVGTSTDQFGAYELAVPRELVASAGIQLQVSYVGFVGQLRDIAVGQAVAPQSFQLQDDAKVLMGEVVCLKPSVLPPAPWRPRAFYYWGKYWVTRPFRR